MMRKSRPETRLLNSDLERRLGHRSDDTSPAAPTHQNMSPPATSNTCE